MRGKTSTYVVTVYKDILQTFEPTADVRNHPKIADVLLGLRFSCRMRDCNDRFANERYVTRHLFEKHGLSEQQIEETHALDTCETANFYRFFDECRWLDRNERLRHREACRLLPSLTEKSKEFVKMHVQNTVKRNGLKAEIKRLREFMQKSHDTDVITLLKRTLARRQQHLDISMSRMLSEEEFE